MNIKSKKCNTKKRKNLFKNIYFLDCDKETHSVLTVYKYFESEEIIKNFDGIEDYKIFKQKIREKWESLSTEEKFLYKSQCSKNSNWITKCRNLKKINSVSLLIRKEFDFKKENKEPLPKLNEIIEKWKKLSKKEKEKFQQIAENMEEEKEILYIRLI